LSQLSNPKSDRQQGKNAQHPGLADENPIMVQKKKLLQRLRRWHVLDDKYQEEENCYPIDEARQSAETATQH